MTRRFEVLRATHLGPLQDNLSPGDVIWWNPNSRVLMINGWVQKETKSRDFEKAVEVLEKQMKKDPKNPIVKEMHPVDTSATRINPRANERE